MTTITFLVCLMYLWCSHHSWSVSYLLCFTTAYLLSYTFNNLLSHLLKHTVIILSVISRLCHMWHHVHLSVPAGLRSAPVAHPWHALMPCCGRFNVLSGLLLPCCSTKRGRASALRRSTIRHPAVTVALLPPPPHDCHGHYSFGTNAAHSSERCLIMCYETGISPSHFILRKFLQVSFSSGSRFPCVCLCFRGIYCTSSLSTLGTSYFHDLCVCHIIRS